MKLLIKKLFVIELFIYFLYKPTSISLFCYTSQNIMRYGTTVTMSCSKTL